jgi:hypothetical protein
MFGMLFGAGFAIQLRLADTRGESFLPKYQRRVRANAQEVPGTVRSREVGRSQ